VDVVPAEAEARGRARSPVLEDDVGARGQPPGDGAAVGGLEIDRDRPFVAVEGHERRGFTGHVRPHGPGLVALAGTLDLHDVGAEVGQDHRAVGPGELTGEIEDGEAGEGAWHRGSEFTSRAFP